MKTNRVIVADTDADQRFLFSEALRIVNGESKVIEVSNAKQLLSLLVKETTSPVLIIMDINIALTGDEELSGRLQSFEQFRKMHKVFLLADNSFKEQAFNAGADAFYMKPKTLDGFLAIAKSIRQRYLQQQAPEH